MVERTLRVLEFNTVREMLLSQAVCSETVERCRSLQPVDNIYEAKKLLSLTGEAESLIIKKGAPPISPVRNVTGSVKRAAAGGVLSMSELLAVGHVLRMARALVNYCDEDDFDKNYPSLHPVFTTLGENRKLENTIFSAILSDEEMADDASGELLAIRRKMRSLHSKIRDVMKWCIPHLWQTFFRSRLFQCVATAT